MGDARGNARSGVRRAGPSSRPSAAPASGESAGASDEPPSRDAFTPAWSWPGLQDPLEPLLLDLVDTCGRASPVAVILVHLWHADIRELRGVAGIHMDFIGPPTTAHLWCRILPDEHLPVTEALRTGRVVTVESQAAGAARYPRPDRQTWGGRTGSCLAVPIGGPIGAASDEGAPVHGVLTVAFATPVPFEPRLVARVRAFAELIGEEVARLEELPRAEPLLAHASTDGLPEPFGTAAGGTPRRGGRRSRAAVNLEATLDALDAAGSGTFDWDLRTGTIALDTRLGRLLGSASGYHGPIEPVLCALHPDDYPGLRMTLAEAFAESGRFTSGHRLIDPDGRWRWIEARGSVVPGPGPEPERLRGVVTDVTEVSDLRTSLAHQAEELDALVIVVDDEWRLVYCNAASETLFGRPRAEVIGRPLHGLLPEAHNPAWGRHLFEALQERSARSFTLHVPGPDRWFKVSAHPRRDQMLLFCVDVTDERRAAAERREAAQAVATQQARIQLLTAALAESLTVREVVRAARRLPAVCGADGLAIGMIQDGRLRVVGHAGYPPRGAGAYPAWDLGEDAPFVEAVRRRTALAITSREEYVRRYPHLAELAGAAGKQAWMFLPLVASGEVVGTAVLSYNRRREFDAADYRLFGQMRALLARALHRARRYDDEHAMSSGLQRGLLPGRPARIPGLTIATRYIPATVGMQVGGDWHDVISLPRGRVGLVIGDVQGHGVDAAAIMGMLRTAVLAYAVEGHRPAEVVRRTNALTAGLGTDLFATCAYVELDPATGRAVVVRAGHQHPAVLGSSGSRLVDVPGGLPLGIDTDARYPETEVTLAPNDVLVLCTDGLVESRGLSLDEGVAWMLETLENARGMTPDGLAGHLIARRTGELGDDIALLLARYDGAGG
ncbi:SpoIIE family protein phosphatase [Yinghuangia seranimata]|uniref:SpoIIE family protein phosphatase n=1 Tax=Yinghuangia seranimata TaxID=408067 RepID=UPI00248C2D0F|nr:SpoIIE family protein phosphatase [Yinghuangia seranimata]MDI2127785.1 SpoIIE family protein phosphatase [Yinghuangia seranimata]